MYYLKKKSYGGMYSQPQSRNPDSEWLHSIYVTPPTPYHLFLTVFHLCGSLILPRAVLLLGTNGRNMPMGILNT